MSAGRRTGTAETSKHTRRAWLPLEGARIATHPATDGGALSAEATHCRRVPAGPGNSTGRQDLSQTLSFAKRSATFGRPRHAPRGRAPHSVATRRKGVIHSRKFIHSEAADPRNRRTSTT